jgi:hypothetical protein
MPQETDKAIREIPRDAEVTDLLKKVSEEGPLPRYNRNGRVWSMTARHNIEVELVELGKSVIASSPQKIVESIMSDPAFPPPNPIGLPQSPEYILLETLSSVDMKCRASS